MKILAYNNQALSINGKGVYIEDLSALAENGSLIKIVTPIVNKGDLIYLDVDGKGDKLYRVLKCKGDVAKVVAMYDDLTSKYNETNTTTTMGTFTVQKYEGSTLDTYLNTTWYNTLSNEAKNAIVPENVVCDAWNWGNIGDLDYTGTYGGSVPGTTNYTISKHAGVALNIGNRNIFALGVQDVIDYLSDESMRIDTTAILRNINIWKMFWNDEVSPSDNDLWLRSSRAGSSNSAWIASGSGGYLHSSGVSYSKVVRPAFNINLSQIPFTKKKGETWIINDFSSSPTAAIIDNIEFTSNSKIFTKITISRESKLVSYLLYDLEKVASILYETETKNWSTSWTNSAYRTITFTSPATGDLLTWLQANAVKQ